MTKLDLKRVLEGDINSFFPYNARLLPCLLCQLVLLLGSTPQYGMQAVSEA